MGLKFTERKAGSKFSGGLLLGKKDFWRFFFFFFFLTGRTLASGT